MAPLHPQLPGGRPVLLPLPSPPVPPLLLLLPPPVPPLLLLLPLPPLLLPLPPPLTLDASESPGLSSLTSAPHAATSAKDRQQTPPP
ncbi:hypothetical protein [Sorangium sp. So ce1389]|uniref:hypothetical protein n=1 Tax=Sorangium sp. So ce1389 TaxID=3133336 RepID=UPI003F5E5964